jgi:WD40 repeat protein
MIAALVAAACMPVAWPLLGGVPEAAKAAVALLGATGGSYISESLKTVIERIRKRDGVPVNPADLQEALERELLTRLEAKNEQAAGLRTEAASLLERVQAVETALGAASADVQLALTQAFVDLGDTFGEFDWILQEARQSLDAIKQEQAHQGAEQRHQTELLRETRIKVDLALRRLEAPAPSSSAHSMPAHARDEDEAPAPGPSPYKGLEVFQPEDAEWFFGRDHLVAELAVRLSETGFLAVIGPSGSGKSSVLRAGLLPAVWRGELPGEGAWTTIVMTPGTHPLDELATRLGAESGVAAGFLLDDWRIEPRRVHLALHQVLAKRPAGSRLLLVIDQFEETFTLCSQEAERRAFIQGLTGALEGPDPQVNVVLGVRADFYARCAEYPELIEVLQDRQVLVGPMTTAEAREAIIGPAAQAGLSLEPGLVEMVLVDLGEEPGSLPLLSHALFATWQRRRARVLTMAGYEEAGGVRQGIARTAESLFSKLDSAQQAVAQDIFLRLTALGEGTEDTRRRVRRPELSAGQDAEAVALVLDRLAEARLVTLGEDSIEVAHEALIREWPALRQWLAEDREGLRIHRRLTEAASDWETLGRDSSVLYKGVQLSIVRDWAERSRARLNDLERAFVAASGRRERDELAAARRRNRRLGALSAILVVASVVAVWQTNTARRQTRTARQQRDLATARQFAAQSLASADQQPASLLLSLESLRITPTNEGWAALQQGLLHPGHNVLAFRPGAGPISGLAFSPDGKTIAIAGIDVRLWDIVSGKPIGRPLMGPLSGLALPTFGTGVAFSPDGKTLAIAGIDVRLWDVATGKQIGQPLTVPSSGGQMRGVAFSPDGKTIASGGNDIRLWDVATDKQVGQPLAEHIGPVSGVAFSSDGKMLASAGTDVRLWDVASSKQIGQPLPGTSMAFSADGKTVASVGDDVGLWSVATGKQVGQILTAADAVAFSPDGRTLVSAGGDGTVRLWEVATGKPVDQPLTGHKGPFVTVAFSPDGKTIASGDFEGTVRLWEVATGTPIGQPLTGQSPIVLPSRVAFSPDGKTIASGGSDVRLWDVATGKQIGHALVRYKGPILDVAFSPDGKTLVSATHYETMLWDVATGGQIRKIQTGSTPPLAGSAEVSPDLGGLFGGVALSADGKTLAVSGADGKVQIWNTFSGKQIGDIGDIATHLNGPFDGLSLALSPNGTTLAASDGSHGLLLSVASGKRIGQPLTFSSGLSNSHELVFSPDGKMLTFGGSVWNIESGQPTQYSTPSNIQAVAVSSDGKMLALASTEAFAAAQLRLWNVKSRKQIGPLITLTSLPALPSQVNKMAFSPDGKTLAVAGIALELWPSGIEAWVRHACDQAGRNLTQLEWDQYLPGTTYVRTCPQLPSGYDAPRDAPGARYQD